MQYLLKKTIWDRFGNIYYPSQTPYKEGELSQELLDKHSADIIKLNDNQTPVYEKIDNSLDRERLIDTQIGEETKGRLPINQEVFDTSKVTIVNKKNLNTLEKKEMLDSQDFTLKKINIILEKRPFKDWKSFNSLVKPEKDYTKLGYVIENETESTKSN
jgi:hypothetical protein